MAHGLLGGGPSPGESQYSSDEGTSDTEEYEQSKPMYIMFDVATHITLSLELILSLEGQ